MPAPADSPDRPDPTPLAGFPDASDTPSSTDLAVDQEIELFLSLCRTATLATVDDEGHPHAANVQVVHGPGWALQWTSAPASAHSQHLGDRPHVAMTLYAHRDDPASIHGLQLHGRVDPPVGVDHPDWPTLWDRYVGKYGFVASTPKLKKAAERQRFYVFRPTWLRWIDNRRAFGWKSEKTL